MRKVSGLAELLGYGVLMAMVALSSAASAAATPSRPPDSLRAWVGLKDPDALDNWIHWQIAEEQRLIAGLLAVKDPRNTENTLLPYDRALMHLSLAGGQGGVMFEVNPNSAIRDKAQALAQVVSAEFAAITLNQDIYHALAAVDVSHADAATKHYMERILLEYKLNGVDKDQATREKLKKLQDQMTEISLKFSRNVQDDVRSVHVKDKSELDGLPDDYIARHSAGSDGTITITTDSPDYTPVMSYAKSAKLRRELFLAYNNRAYPANSAILKQLLQVRQEFASILGFPTWADYATADQMMGSAAKMRTFLDEVDVASRDRAKRSSTISKSLSDRLTPPLCR